MHVKGIDSNQCLFLTYMFLTVSILACDLKHLFFFIKEFVPRVVASHLSPEDEESDSVWPTKLN